MLQHTVLALLVVANTAAPVTKATGPDCACINKGPDCACINSKPTEKHALVAAAKVEGPDCACINKGPDCACINSKPTEKKALVQKGPDCACINKGPDCACINNKPEEKHALVAAEKGPDCACINKGPDCACINSKPTSKQLALVAGHANATDASGNGTDTARLVNQLAVQKTMLADARKAATSLRAKLATSGPDMKAAEDKLKEIKPEVADLTAKLAKQQTGDEKKALAAQLGKDRAELASEAAAAQQVASELEQSKAHVKELETEVPRLRAGNAAKHASLVSTLASLKAAVAMRLPATSPAYETRSASLEHEDGKTTTADWGTEYGPKKVTSAAVVMSVLALLVA